MGKGTSYKQTLTIRNLEWDANQNFCSDHFAIYTNTESVCYTPETNIMSTIPQLKKIELQNTYSKKEQN